MSDEEMAMEMEKTDYSVFNDETVVSLETIKAAMATEPEEGSVPNTSYHAGLQTWLAFIFRFFPLGGVISGVLYHFAWTNSEALK